MNIREGMRRVGIVLGALGCVAGGIFGYWNLKNAWSSHTRFERLLALPVMHDVNAAIKDDLDSLAKQCGHMRFSSLSPDEFMKNQGKTSANAVLTPSKPPESSVADFENWRKQEAEKNRRARQAPNSIPANKSEFTIGPVETPNTSQVTIRPDDEVTITPDEEPKKLNSEAQGFDVYEIEAPDKSLEGITVIVNGTEGIQAANADKTGAIYSIALTTGESVYRRSKTLKARLAFIATLLMSFSYPAIGFLLPWGTIKIFVWVGTGFVEPRGSA